MARSFSEKYRPATLAEFLGNPKAVQAARCHAQRGIGSKGFWISGGTGFGKTTLARILAQTLAPRVDLVEYDSADQISQAEFDRLAAALTSRSLFADMGRVVIINEAHGLTGRIMRQFLGLLERLPETAAIIFTTTNDGQGVLFENIDGKPLLHRCEQIPLTNQGLSEVVAQRLVAVGQAEGFSVPLSKAREVASDGKNSFRAALEWLGSPQSMAYLDPPASAVA